MSEMNAGTGHYTLTGNPTTGIVERVRFGRWELFFVGLAGVGTFGSFVVEVGRAFGWWL